MKNRLLLFASTFLLLCGSALAGPNPFARGYSLLEPRPVFEPLERVVTEAKTEYRSCHNEGPFYATCNFKIWMGQTFSLQQLSCTNWAEITWVKPTEPWGTGTVTLYTGPQGGTSTWSGVTDVEWLGDCLQEGLYE